MNIRDLNKICIGIMLIILKILLALGRYNSSYNIIYDIM